MTAPLAFRFTTRLPAGAGDLWQNYWNFWWWKQAVFELAASPYRTEYLFFPSGTDLVFYTHSAFNQIVALPINWLLGEAAAYNFCLLLALTLSGYGAYRLTRELAGDPLAGALAGIVFAYFPQHMEQTLEHLNLFSTQFLPLALYYLVRLLRRGSGRDALGLGIMFALNALCSWHLGLMLILSIAPLVIAGLIRPERPRLETLKLVGLAGLLAALLVWPAVDPLIERMIAGETYYQKPDVDRGIDPLYLITPHYAHPVAGPLLISRYLDRAYQASGFVCYLGFVPIGLAFLAVRRGVRGRLYWLGYSLATLALALGSPMWFNGTLLEGVRWLPYELIRGAPLLTVLNVANRFLILTSLGLAVLVGLGWTALRNRSDKRFYLLAGLVLFEYWWLPYPTQEARFPEAYAEMREGPILRIGAVLDIPFHQRNRTVHNMAAQTVHGRPIGGGYLTTYPPETLAAIENEPALADLAGVPKLQRPIDFRRLIQLGFDTVVLHKYRADSYGKQAVAAVPREDLLGRKAALRLGGVPDAKLDAIRAQLEAHSGPAAFEDELVAIFYLKPSQPLE